MKRWWPWIILGLVGLLPFFELVLPQAWRIGPLMLPVLCYAILGLGLNLVVGSTGLLNLGAAAFVAVGAFGFAILTSPIYPFQIGFWAGLGAALCIGALFGLVLGLPTMRLRGDYLAIVTLGFGEIVQDLLRNLATITQGTKSINPLPTPSLPGYVFLGVSQSWKPWFWLYLGLLALVLLLLRNLERSRYGRILVAVREDELAARCMGVNVARAKLCAFAGGAALCALAGALMACSLSSSSEPGNYDFNLSVLALCIIILGGLGNIWGVVLGALIMGGFNSIVLAKLDIAIRSLSSDHSGAPAPLAVLMTPANWKYLVFGVVLVLVMRYRPAGLLPARRGATS